MRDSPELLLASIEDTELGEALDAREFAAVDAPGV
jgi:hypothetical protein